MPAGIYETSGVQQSALETTIAGAWGVYFNISGWYELTAIDGSTAQFLVAAGQTIPGRWTKAEAIDTPDPTTDLETVFLK